MNDRTQSIMLDDLLARFVSDMRPTLPTRAIVSLPVEIPEAKGKPRALDPVVIRLMHMARRHPGKPACQCVACKHYFVQTYVSLGWGDERAWPQDSTWYCRECRIILNVRLDTRR